MHQVTNPHRYMHRTNENFKSTNIQFHAQVDIVLKAELFIEKLLKTNNRKTFFLLTLDFDFI